MVIDLLVYFLVALAGIFVIVNPITTSFIFASLASNATEKEQKRIASRAARTATVVLVVFALVGGSIFIIFGITLAAFRIAGGLILFGIGMKMLNQGENEKVHKKHLGKLSETISIVPLAIPFISGPGAIAAVMVFSTEAPSVAHLSMILLAIFVSTFTCYILMINSKYIVNFIGEVGKQVVTKIFGLILSVIAIQFVINGIKDVLVDLDLISLIFFSLV